MKRLTSPVRPDLEAICAYLGFDFAFIDGEPYWDESARYVFTLEEIERDIEAPTNDLGAMCLEVAASAVRDERILFRLGIPAHAHQMVADSWQRRDPSLYGRFDLAYDGAGPVKLLEFNADTPTSIYEAAVFQWHWLEHGRERGFLPPDADQFNSLHDALIVQWGEILPGRSVTFAAMDSEEDRGTIEYLADCARQAGKSCSTLTMREIGLRGDRFIDSAGRAIDVLFKLYPWEWVIQDEFGRSAAMARTTFVEPAWKMMLSTKGLLPLLWKLAPGHPNLLPAFFEDDPACAHLKRTYVRKPIHSREGDNVEIITGGLTVAQTGGAYGAAPCIRQAPARLPRFDGNHPVIGSWLIGGRSHGIGVREDTNLITSNTSRFIPHTIEG